MFKKLASIDENDDTDAVDIDVADRLNCGFRTIPLLRAPSPSVLGLPIPIPVVADSERSIWPGSSLKLDFFSPGVGIAEMFSSPPRSSAILAGRFGSAAKPTQ